MVLGGRRRNRGARAAPFAAGRALDSAARVDREGRRVPQSAPMAARFFFLSLVSCLSSRRAASWACFDLIPRARSRHAPVWVLVLRSSTGVLSFLV